MKNFKLITGDSFEILKQMKENSIDSIVTDPPYELGFMGNGWDKSGIANNVEFWKEALRVLKPGGHMLAFSHSRTEHRMTCAIEDAGFEIRDKLQWIYGSGFPKSHDISKAIDKTLGKKQKVIGVIKDYRGENKNTGMGQQKDKKIFEGAVSDEAKKWDGWGTALKPAYEPIVMARKPLSEKTIADNVLEHNVGGINIDKSRIVATGKDKEQYDKDMINVEREIVKQRGGVKVFGNSGHKPMTQRETTDGRFPSNVILENTQEIKEMFPNTKSSGKPNQETKGTKIGDTQEGTSWSKPETGIRNNRSDSGSASRFFYGVDYDQEDKTEGLEQNPIVMARKPLDEKTVADNVLKHGTGGINIDDSRIQGEPIQKNVGVKEEYQNKDGGWGVKKNITELGNDGRHPANIILEDSPEVRESFPTTKKGGAIRKDYKIDNNVYGDMSMMTSNHTEGYGDSGSAARFFYGSKCSPKDRNEGLEKFEDKQIWASQEKRESNSFDIFESDGRKKTLKKNNHPTVKPTDLMMYLVRLITPKNGFILDPFNGSGSTGKAVSILNKNEEKDYKYIGIDLDKDKKGNILGYIDITKARIEYALNNETWIEGKKK